MSCVSRSDTLVTVLVIVLVTVLVVVVIVTLALIVVGSTHRIYRFAVVVPYDIARYRCSKSVNRFSTGWHERSSRVTACRSTYAAARTLSEVVASP